MFLKMHIEEKKIKLSNAEHSLGIRCQQLLGNPNSPSVWTAPLLLSWILIKSAYLSAISRTEALANRDELYSSLTAQIKIAISLSISCSRWWQWVQRPDVKNAHLGTSTAKPEVLPQVHFEPPRRICAPCIRQMSFTQLGAGREWQQHILYTWVGSWGGKRCARGWPICPACWLPGSSGPALDGISHLALHLLTSEGDQQNPPWDHTANLSGEMNFSFKRGEKKWKL